MPGGIYISKHSAFNALNLPAQLQQGRMLKQVANGRQEPQDMEGQLMYVEVSMACQPIDFGFL